MDCKEVRNLFSEYLENESFAQREIVREHLRICKNCACEFEEFKKAVSAVAGLEKLKAPQDLLEGVHRKLKPKPQVNEIWKRLFYPLHIKLPLEAVAVAATVFLILTIYNQSAFKPEPQQVTLKSEAEKSPVAMLAEEKGEKRELAKVPVIEFPQKETTIILVSHDIERDLKLLPVLVNEVGGEIIAPPREALGEKALPPPPIAQADMKMRGKVSASAKYEEVPAPVKSFDMTFQIPSDKMPIFMQKLEAIGPSRTEFEKTEPQRVLKLKETSRDEPIIIHLKLNTP